MLSGLEALIAFEKLGTLSEAAVHLRISQSAVTKRIQALEQTFGFKLVEPDGRKLKLTERAAKIVAKAQPIMEDVDSLRLFAESDDKRKICLGIGESIAASWGPKLLRQALNKLPNIDVSLHVHRSSLVVEQLRLGRYEMGIVAGRPNGNDLDWTPIGKEKMVLFGSDKSSNRILTIERSSATWKDIGAGAELRKEMADNEFVFLESFSAAAQMAKQGFGRALVPMGVAEVHECKPGQFVNLEPKIFRKIHIVTRKSFAAIPDVREFIKCVASLTGDLLG